MINMYKMRDRNCEILRRHLTLNNIYHNIVQAMLNTSLQSYDIKIALFLYRQNFMQPQMSYCYQLRG